MWTHKHVTWKYLIRREKKRKKKEWKRVKKAYGEFFWTIKWTHICLMGDQEEERKGGKMENLTYRNNVWKLSKSLRDMNIQVCKAQESLNSIIPWKSTPRHVIIKISKGKMRRKFWKQKSHLWHTREQHKATADFSEEILQARREQDNIFKVLGKIPDKKNTQFRKAVLHKWKIYKDLLRQRKVVRVIHH